MSGTAAPRTHGAPTAPTTPVEAVLDPRRVPVRVTELDWCASRLNGPGGRAGVEDVAADSRRFMALVRVHGSPLGIVHAEVPGGSSAQSVLVDAAGRALGGVIAAHLAGDEVLADRMPGRGRALSTGEAGPVDASGTAAATVTAAAATEPAEAEPPCRRHRSRILACAPLISVIVATRNRTDSLARCLDSVLRLDYPRFEVIVVDNDPADDATKSLVARLNADRASATRLTYVREPVRGLATAHNRGIALARGRIIAFTDDDVLVDRDWLAAIAQAFADDERAGCVTGLIMPAELETPAQAMLESYGGFAKGFTPRRFTSSTHASTLRARTSAPRTLSLSRTFPRSAPRTSEAADDAALFPLAVFRVGSGANMAFRAQVLERIGGFDPATGAGSRAKGGDDLLAFFRTLTAGHAIVYRPDAVVWHHHRRTAQDLAAQAYAYGTGLGAYLTAAVASEPRLLPALLSRLPCEAVRKVRSARAGFDSAQGWPAGLAARERRGILSGPLAYARSRHDVRVRSRSQSQSQSQSEAQSQSQSGAQSRSQSRSATSGATAVRR